MRNLPSSSCVRELGSSSNREDKSREKPKSSPRTASKVAKPMKILLEENRSELWRATAALRKQYAIRRDRLELTNMSYLCFKYIVTRSIQHRDSQCLPWPKTAANPCSSLATGRIPVKTTMLPARST